MDGVPNHPKADDLKSSNTNMRVLSFALLAAVGAYHQQPVPAHSRRAALMVGGGAAAAALVGGDSARAFERTVFNDNALIAMDYYGQTGRRLPRVLDFSKLPTTPEDEDPEWAANKKPGGDKLAKGETYNAWCAACVVCLS